MSEDQDRPPQWWQETSRLGSEITRLNAHMEHSDRAVVEIRNDLRSFHVALEGRIANSVGGLRAELLADIAQLRAAGERHAEEHRRGFTSNLDAINNMAEVLRVQQAMAVRAEKDAAEARAQDQRWRLRSVAVAVVLFCLSLLSALDSDQSRALRRATTEALKETAAAGAM